MLSIFNRKNKKPQGKEAIVDSKDLLEGEGVESSDLDVYTELSYHPAIEMTTEEKYYYQFLNNELPPLKENQLSLSGIELKKLDNGYAINAFVRNTLNKTIKLQSMHLLLIDADGKQLGRKEFDLSLLEELPPRSSRPWYFVFEDQYLTEKDIPATGWKLAFELKRAHSLDLADSWKENLSSEEQEKLEKLVQSLTPPKDGEVNFMGLQIKHAETGELHVTMLIRNGSHKNINLQQLPLIVEDATGEVVAKGGFTLESFEVKANTSKPWTFIFPGSLVVKENPDLTKWKAYPPQGN
ncbi:accessory Sec system S-layer assembly protein [Bacillus sp. AK128]